MSDTNSMYSKDSKHSFFGDRPNFYVDPIGPRDITKGSSNAEKVYES